MVFSPSLTSPPGPPSVTIAFEYSCTEADGGRAGSREEEGRGRGGGRREVRVVGGISTPPPHIPLLRSPHDQQKSGHYRGRVRGQARKTKRGGWHQRRPRRANNNQTRVRAETRTFVAEPPPPPSVASKVSSLLSFTPYPLCRSSSSISSFSLFVLLLQPPSCLTPEWLRGGTVAAHRAGSAGVEGGDSSSGDFP